MRKKLVDIVLIIICVVAFITILTGCGYEETKEYELLTVRRYSETTESGTFTTKEDTNWYIEFTYQTEEGIQKYDFNESYDSYLEISEENKVVLEEGDVSPTLYITLEKYKELYGIKEEGGIE
jgi:hypothetical protein